jgi:hypothetical protein
VIPSGATGAIRGALADKTFWWSKDFDVTAERVPDIKVTARQWGGSTTASADPHTTHGWVTGAAPFMLVGLSLPDYGCWAIRAEYRGHVLEYVEEVVAP